MLISSLFRTAVDHSEGVLCREGRLPDMDNSDQGSSMRFEELDDDGVLGGQPSLIVLDPDLGPCGERFEAVADSDCKWDLSGTLNMPGLKHTFSNISGDVLKRWTQFPKFQEALTAVTTLHHQAFYRDRLEAIVKTEFKPLFRFFEGGNLIMWRWSSLVDVCEALHRREGALRSSWNLHNFLRAGKPHQGGEGHQGHAQDAPEATKLFLALQTPSHFARTRITV